jgi:hypothetical protein
MNKGGAVIVRRTNRRKCALCGQNFRSKHCDTKFCSTFCTMRATRARKRAGAQQKPDSC